MVKTPSAPPSPRLAALESLGSTCLHCAFKHGRVVPLQSFRYRHELQVGTRRFRALLTGGRCAVCGHGGRGAAELDYLAGVARRLADEGDRQPEAVRFIREQACLPATRLARLLGVSRQTVHRWESGHTPIDLASFAILRLLLHEAARDEDRALHEWLERVNGLPRAPFRRLKPGNRGHAPALDRAARKGPRTPRHKGGSAS